MLSSPLNVRRQRSRTLRPLYITDQSRQAAWLEALPKALDSAETGLRFDRKLQGKYHIQSEIS